MITAKEPKVERASALFSLLDQLIADCRWWAVNWFDETIHICVLSFTNNCGYGPRIEFSVITFYPSNMRKSKSNCSSEVYLKYVHFHRWNQTYISCWTFPGIIPTIRMYVYVVAHALSMLGQRRKIVYVVEKTWEGVYDAISLIMKHTKTNPRKII